MTRTWITKIKKFLVFKIIFPATYLLFRILPLDDDKVLFMELRYGYITNSFQTLYTELKCKYSYNIHVHFLRNGDCRRGRYFVRCLLFIMDMATAKYIFLNESNNIISFLPMRKESVVTQLWHGCGAFKKFGLSTADLLFGESRQGLSAYPFNRHYTYVTVSSAEVIWAYEEAMGLKNEKEKILPIGISRTDVFFNTDYLDRAYAKVSSTVPQTKGKKIILYAPTFRGHTYAAETSMQLSVPQFYKALSTDYILLIKHHPLVKKRPIIPEEYKNFAFDLSESVDINDLLCVADVCITDYSSLVFEFSLMEKPIIFFAYDYDKYCDWRGFYYDYNELTPGPIFETNEEMINYIKRIDVLFNPGEIRRFKDKFMSACDGHATERIMNLVFSNSLLLHRR